MEQLALQVCGEVLFVVASCYPQSTHAELLLLQGEELRRSEERETELRLKLDDQEIALKEYRRQVHAALCRAVTLPCCHQLTSNAAAARPIGRTCYYEVNRRNSRRSSLLCTQRR